MIDKVSDILGWERKYTIKALNGKVSHGPQAKKRSSKPIYSDEEISVVIEIWKSSNRHNEPRCKHKAHIISLRLRTSGKSTSLHRSGLVQLRV